jgi:hypothetical protein
MQNQISTPIPIVNFGENFTVKNILKMIKKSDFMPYLNDMLAAYIITNDDKSHMLQLCYNKTQYEEFISSLNNSGEFEIRCATIVDANYQTLMWWGGNPPYQASSIPTLFFPQSEIIKFLSPTDARVDVKKLIQSYKNDIEFGSISLATHLSNILSSSPIPFESLSSHNSFKMFNQEWEWFGFSDDFELSKYQSPATFIDSIQDKLDDEDFISSCYLSYNPIHK